MLDVPFHPLLKKVGMEPLDFFSGEDKMRIQKKKEKRYKAEIDEDGKVIFYSKTHQTKVREAERYHYFKEDGSLAFSVIRSHPKDFRPLQPDGHLDLNGIERIPYRLPELIKSIQSHETIFITEGEKDCDRGNEIGLSCTTFLRVPENSRMSIPNISRMPKWAFFLIMTNPESKVLRK